MYKCNDLRSGSPTPRDARRHPHERSALLGHDRLHLDAVRMLARHGRPLKTAVSIRHTLPRRPAATVNDRLILPRELE